MKEMDVWNEKYRDAFATLSGKVGAYLDMPHLSERERLERISEALDEAREKVGWGSHTEKDERE